MMRSCTEWRKEREVKTHLCRSPRWTHISPRVWLESVCQSHLLPHRGVSEFNLTVCVWLFWFSILFIYACLCAYRGVSIGQEPWEMIRSVSPMPATKFVHINNIARRCVLKKWVIACNKKQIINCVNINVFYVTVSCHGKIWLDCWFKLIKGEIQKVLLYPLTCYIGIKFDDIVQL